MIKTGATIAAIAVVLAMAGSAGAQTWQATTELTAESNSSCPKPSVPYEFTVKDTTLTVRTPVGATHSGTIAADGRVEIRYPASGPTAAKLGTTTLAGNARTRELRVSASGLEGCVYALRPSGGTASVAAAGPAAAIVGTWKGPFSGYRSAYFGEGLVLAILTDGKCTAAKIGRGFYNPDCKYSNNGNTVSFKSGGGESIELAFRNGRLDGSLESAEGIRIFVELTKQ